ncbi:NB-ARC domain-containing protein [Emticicia sp. C21]|uniref:NB-ARC domain-containing protein n=1 Tax=Emticicia sp. C21 TaxID=2302915 RepID=UPI000E348740|nr:NB-ARC domain-containing protein [Emticicia sp. C21]RFS16851.1 hypothetical protein D0T08_09225 [Emticicia sp. C21]
MKKELLDLININRNAIATNRGFYYQYLNVVLKWINNYVNARNVDVYTEVDDDIKEVGDELIFTQLKCYSSAFSFNSVEIQKTLLNFFALYLQYQDFELTFYFTTNSSISKNEEILSNWIVEQPPLNKEILSLCTSKVSEVLADEIRKIKIKRLSKEDKKPKMKQALMKDFEQLNGLVYDKLLITDFVNKIRWEFGEVQTERAVEKLVLEILDQLRNPIFGGRPVTLLLDAMLSEIYRRSQLTDTEQRKVNNKLLKSILALKDEELYSYIDTRLSNLFNVRLENLENRINTIDDVLKETVNAQKEYSEALETLIRDKVSSKHEIPKRITKIPYIDTSSVFGREDILTSLHKLLSEVRHISINGNGGMGKSTILKLYIHSYKDDYDHIIWINAQTGLVNSITINQEIATNLNIPILDADKFSERFDLILNKLHQISGNNLLIIDGYSKTELQLSELRTLNQWRIIVGTRLRLPGWKLLPIRALSFESAKALYHSFGNQQTVDDTQLINLFNYVEYNTLIIALVAKTIYYSFDLTLDILIKHFEEQSLDDDHLKIELVDEEGDSSHLLNILNKTFDLSKVDPMENFFMSFFALISIEDTNFEDLIDWFGIEAEKENRVLLTNAINSLHAKGFIERSGQQISMHKMLQDSILYQERKRVGAFSGHFINIESLTNRIKEGAEHSISKALRFLKFGEAILTNIKEPYRKNIYRSLLLLENEVLNIYNWLKTDSDLVSKWRNLMGRAEKYLSSEDGLLGVISNNFGLALVAKDELLEATKRFEDAITILQSQGTGILPKLITSLCNLCLLFIQQRRMKRFNECFQTIMSLRKKHNLYDDVSMPIQSQVLGEAYQKIGNYPEAIKLYNMAISLHVELPIESRNDVKLAYYYIKLCESYLSNKELIKAEKAIIITIDILSRQKASGLTHVEAAINLMIIIVELKGDYEDAEKLREALRNMNA